MTDKIMIEVLPAILEKSFDAVKEKLARLKGIVDRAQLDIADGVFVSETSWQGLSQLSELDSIGYRHASRSSILPLPPPLTPPPPLRRTGRAGPPNRRAGGEFKFDLHLMADRPEQWVIRANNPSVFRVTFHQEASRDIGRTIGLIRSQSKEVGVALNLDTPVSAVYDILEEIDLVLLMAIVPGAQGREFNPKVLEKIRELRARDPAVKIGVDGGVSPAAAPALIAAGANVLVCGSWLWVQEDVGEAIRLLGGKV